MSQFSNDSLTVIRIKDAVFELRQTQYLVSFIYDSLEMPNSMTAIEFSNRIGYLFNLYQTELNRTLELLEHSLENK